ncbi:DUF3261 domain-containing protein [Francisella frigiditurris]|uniref:Lipoprotein n=1 Tax=Francisella frigiditurris TaxID=1542390 RepID=A0A1J0KS98_9GAMM|nr:DUF3261 domain-containing protein [Francisella frigiditurris]APC96609.1 hypothetical protein KX01_1342 [Francisella frigiditurris]
MKIKSLFLVLFILLTGCAIFENKENTDTKLEFLPGTIITLPKPSSLDLDMNISQIVSATYHVNEKTSNFSTQVEIILDSKHIVMIALSGWGGSLFKLDYNGNKIESSSLPMPNQNMGVKESLLEFIISYAPSQVVEKMFNGTGIILEEKLKERCLIKDDQKIMCIQYKADKPWLGQILIHNYHYNYTVEIDTLSYKLNK